LHGAVGDKSTPRRNHAENITVGGTRVAAHGCRRWDLR
jgi:hypothetical protein